MEFNNRAGQTPPPAPMPQHRLSTITYVSEGALRGRELAPGVFPVQVNSVEAYRREMEKVQIRRELEKEEIRREILAGEMARRRVLEEEVRREIASERAEGFLVRQLVSMPFNNPRMRINIRQPFTPPHTPSIKDKVIIQARPDADLSGAKRKAETPPASPALSAVDDSEPAPLQKNPKHEWSCSLCQVAATSEKGLHDHLVGKKHKRKEASLRTPTIGLDPRPASQIPQPSIRPASQIPQPCIRPASQILQPCIRPASQIPQPWIAPSDTGILESGKENEAVQKSQSQTLQPFIAPADTSILESGKENQAVQKNQVSGKEAGEAKALPLTRKFKFWCALCEFETRSETEMQSHKMEAKHLANVKKCGRNW